jgi:hypothetical protein
MTGRGFVEMRRLQARRIDRREASEVLVVISTGGSIVAALAVISTAGRNLIVVADGRERFLASLEMTGSFAHLLFRPEQAWSPRYLSFRP